MVKLTFLTRKNDQSHRGHTVYLLYTGGNFCPVLLLKQYQLRLSSALGTRYPVSGALLPHFARKGGKYIPISTKNVSYDAMRKTQISVMKSLNIDYKKFGLQSARRGSATNAASSGHSKPARTAFAGWAEKSDMADHYDELSEHREALSIGLSLKLE